ncbi:MAG: acyl-CoA/acyl-ACP dehydrogenase [Myxococcales bacterium]|nr:acyl-CoA/acyl-ACP dehydrogenase [Myxococcales bacterium]
MDFSFGEEQQAVRDLARRIFADRVSHERSQALEASGEWFDEELWAELGRAQIPGLALPEEVGGSGFGILEIWLVLEEAGRHLAPVPLLPALVLGGPPVAEFGSADQRARWLPQAARGETLLTAALHEAGSADPARPRTSARREGEGWRLDGVKECVPAAQRAAAILVPAQTEDSVGVFLLDPRAPGVKLERQETTNREPQGRLLLSGAAVGEQDVLGDPARGGAIVEWIVERAHVALAALQLGVAEEALRRTAEYVSSRKQFGRSIATFQGVALRAADGWIDLEAMRATLCQAAWRLSQGLPAAREVAAARWWACRGGQRIAHTAQHLHGGIGADVDYPIHRYFLWAKQIELTLGGASEQLARLGSLIARSERAET